ncbi:MAG: hypothetical protein OXJ52_09125 [Oligoflexia bacterium]|nr:hypothetical protein [Oligoflexia bacterium]
MKTIAHFIILFFSVFALLHCNKDPAVVTGLLPTAPAPDTTVAPAQKLIYVYGSRFRVYNGNLYKSLLESCRRCGLKRIIRGLFGQTQYQRFWTSSGDPKRCDNWLSKGYIQIEFLENKLPTTAKFLIQPQYTGHARSYSFDGKEQEIWGSAFEIQGALARPINENKGFEILVSPADGLLGVYNLVVKSENTNHVKNSDLHITVSYGQSDSQTIISQTIERLTKRAVATPQFNCSQYTN